MTDQEKRLERLRQVLRYVENKLAHVIECGGAVKVQYKPDLNPLDVADLADPADLKFFADFDITVHATYPDTFETLP